MTTLGILSNRLRVLIIARLFIAACLLFYVQEVFFVQTAVFYALIAAISVLSAFYLFWLLSAKGLNGLAFFQVAGDLLLESILIFYTGGADSIFAGIYVLSILSSGFILFPQTSFYVAVGSSICYVGTILAVYFNWMPFGIQKLFVGF